jgi:hypothetical protein
MRRAIDRLAASTSTRIVAWTCSRVDASRSEWATALSAELSAIDGGWRKLAWAIGGLPLAWKFSRWGTSRRQSQMGRAQMSDPLPAPRRSSFESFVLNLTTLLAWWMGGFLWVRMIFPDGVRNWLAGDLTILVLSLAGALISLAIRRNGAAYVLAGLGVYQAVEFGFHSQFGIQVVQGGPAHFANMIAGMLGVTMAALCESGAREVVSEQVWNAQDVGVSLRNVGRSIRGRLGLASHVVFGFIAFVAAEVAVRVELAWQVNLMTLDGWRWRHIFFDGKTNYAILCSALLGAAVGMMIARWGDRLAIRLPSRKRAAQSASV